jgi:hypothetical protein
VCARVCVRVCVCVCVCALYHERPRSTGRKMIVYVYARMCIYTVPLHHKHVPVIHYE